MKWWSKRISVMIAKTASRSVAFKSVKLAESAFTSQADVLTRQVATKGLSSNDSEADFQDRRGWRLVSVEMTAGVSTTSLSSSLRNSSNASSCSLVVVEQLSLSTVAVTLISISISYSLINQHN